MKNLINESEKERILKLHEAFGYKTLINEEITPEILKQKYVETGRVSPETYEEIMSVSKNKINYAAWLTKMVAEKHILPEDVYKYEEYFEIFNRLKRHFPIKDINQIKSRPDLQEFLTMVVKMRERSVKGGEESDEDSSKNYVSQSEIQRLENAGIKFMGMVDGYQVFEVPSELNKDQEAWKTYRDILGRCKGRSEGAKIDICTFANFSHFNTYTSDGPLFVIFNMNDPQSPYQFSYETNQFMDKNDNALF
jgi:hypothetical protein